MLRKHDRKSKIGRLECSRNMTLQPVKNTNLTPRKVSGGSNVSYLVSLLIFCSLGPWENWPPTVGKYFFQCLNLSSQLSTGIHEHTSQWGLRGWSGPSNRKPHSPWPKEQLFFPNYYTLVILSIGGVPKVRGHILFRGKYTNYCTILRGYLYHK